MRRHLFASLLLGLITAGALAQQNPGYAVAQLTEKQKNQAVDSIIAVVNNRYVFPDVAKKIEVYLRKQQAKKAYGKITDGNQFAQALTNDLQTAGNDKHLRASYFPEELPVEKERELMSIPPEQREGLGNMLMHTNYGINKIDVLKGNIGYLDIGVFVTPEMAGEKYAAMMNYLAHTDALIIDLRNCGGSMSPDAIPFICSYFFESPVHLNDIQYRKDNKLTQSYTYAYVPGKKYLNKPIYVLISRNTFSGAEELAYDLKNLKRATLIGQPTSGGANPGGDIRANNHFRVFVPIGQAINPITKANWEHVGVQPDTLINTKLALYKAQQLAMRATIATTKEQVWKDALSEWVKELDASKPLFKPVTFELKGFDNAKEIYVAGTFNGWSANETKLERKGDKWVASADSEPGKIRYKFIVDGQWITDPGNTRTETNGPNTDSVKIVD
nr:S41 family peptidase [uncultured Mucilaginibacter sp.]